MSERASQLIPSLFYLLAGVFGAAGQYLYKIGGQRFGVVPLHRNWALWLGVLSFCVVMGFFVAAYRLGGRISVVYPFYATTFVWATLAGVLMDREPWAAVQVGGIAMIVAGVTLVAWGSP